MSEVQTVTLELLRQGPPHNQLLSPLTPYLALSGNHSSVTIRLPFEHNQLLLRLNALRYKDSPETWRVTLEDTASALAEVLGEIPGLIADLSDTSAVAPPASAASWSSASRAEKRSASAGQSVSPWLTHLRLRLSASELALVPFELASAPPGCPGAGQPLLLQAQSPLCITREVRRVGGPRFEWPAEPRILFAAGAGVPPQLVDAHVLALRGAIDPWIDKDAKGQAIMGDVRSRLAVVPRATVESVHAVCRRTRFTHVHVLAHGARLPSEEERYGLLLHKDGDEHGRDVVEGRRLAQIFRTYPEDGTTTLFCPAVVTIAACEGAAQGSVIGIGASVAHVLHEAGVPLVVGSQFPLSFDASVLMVEVLYNGLLWGRDPRTLLNDLRWQLKAKLPDTHDWASIVAYAALPTDISAQLWSTQVSQTRDYFGLAVSYLNRMTERCLKAERARNDESSSNPSKPATRDAVKKMSRRAIRITRNAQKKFWQLLKEAPPENTWQRSVVYRMLGMAHKWEAKVQYSSQERPRSRTRTIGVLLSQARRYYKLSFRAHPGAIEPLVQELSLAAVLEGPRVCADRWWLEKWATARTLGESHLEGQAAFRREDRQRAVDERSDLIELYLLALLIPNMSDTPDFLKIAKEYARKLADQVDDFPETLEAVTYQLKHYTNWYNEYNSDLKDLARPASEVIEALSPGR